MRIQQTTCTLALFSAALLGSATPASAATLVYGLTGDNRLVSFNSGAPGATLSNVPISQAGIVDIDGYPTNGLLYGMTANGSAYTIEPTTGQATLKITPLSSLGTVTDFDFNPAADRIRIYSTGDQNFRMVPDFVTAPQMPGTPGAVTPDGTFSNTSFELVAQGYTNNFDNTAITTLFSIDTTNDQLIRNEGAPQFNTVIPVGSLGIVGGVGNNVGFDVGQDGVAYLSNNNLLYTVDLQSGAATLVGPVTGAPNLVSIATAVPEPSTAIAAAAGMIGLLLRRRR